MKYLNALLCCLLFSCGPQIRAGKIVDKLYHPPYTTTGYNYIYVDEVPIPIPYSINHPAQYRIKIQAAVNNEIKENFIDVSPASFETLQIGEMYGLEK